jgi:hypothetical protein
MSGSDRHEAPRQPLGAGREAAEVEIESVVEADREALEFHQAVLAAHEEHRAAPDPSELTDLAISALLRYPRGELPHGVRRHLGREVTRRLMVPRDRTTEVWGWMALLAPAFGGGTTALVLLGH